MNEQATDTSRIGPTKVARPARQPKTLCRKIALASTFFLGPSSHALRSDHHPARACTENMFLLFNTFFFTLLLFCAFVALAQWRLSKDAAVPWYIGYLAATFLHYGRQFWKDAASMPGVPGIPDPPLEWDTPLSYAAFACYFLFFRQMLEIGAAAPHLNRALMYLARFLGLMSGGHMVVQAAFGRTAADAAHQVFQVLLLPILVWLVARALRYASQFYQKLVLAGTAALVLGFVCVVAKRRWTDEFFLVPEMVCCFRTTLGAFCLYHLKVGVALDVLCFSWALALRQKALLRVALLPPEAQVLETRPPVPDELLEKLDAYLAVHCENEGLKIGDIAKELSISAGQLNRRLQRSTGRTTEQYLLHYRLERAYDLLRSTELPVREVAAAVGLLDLQYFSRAFKKRYGCSPREVRSA
ncbi:MAG: helix-turn-helix domain-containing protein [Saprospiraceae bacterium]